MNSKETKEFIAKTLQKDDNNQNTPILTPDNKDFDFYWNMVKDFDEYDSKTNTLSEQVLNEVLKSECGFELQAASVDLIPNKEKYDLSVYLNSFSLTEKIQWLIEYLDTADKKDIIGLKINDAGTVSYNLKNKTYIKKFIIPIGKCVSNSEKLVTIAKDLFGIFHMKYGQNHHWNESCNALLNIPIEFNTPQWIYPSKSKYNYVFYSKKGYTYAFGVPRNNYQETILISCY